MSQTAPPPGWYTDPSGQHTARWWDGNTWTEHVQDAPQPPPPPPSYTKPAPPSSPPPQAPPQQQNVSYGAPQGMPPGQVQTQYTPDRVQRQVQQQAGVGQAYGGSGHILDEPVLVVNQKTKLIELTNEYAVFDQHGTQVGSVVEVGQSTAKKAVRFLSSLDQFFTHKLEVRDASGTPQLVLTRPAKFVKSRVVVQYPNGAPVGEIVQENAFGKIRFGLMVNGQKIGSINAENWRAWNFSIKDASDYEVARITKTWEGLARTMFTTADNYVVQIHQRLQDPLRAMVVASAVTVDTALKQDSRGLG